MKFNRSFIVLVLVSPLPAMATTRILVPAYFDPSSGTGWSTMTSSVSAYVPITAIMNPDNGPTATVDSTYTAAISSFETAGGEVVGYVYTTGGKRSLSTVEQAVAAYESEYPNIDGIFVDEMANTSAKLSYYQSLYTYIKGVNRNWQVIGNPGTNTLSTYLSSPPAADELVTFENGSGYTSYVPSSWQSSYNASSFANIAYNVSSASTMESYLSLAVSNRTGNVYISDQSGSNPYSALPTYWSQEVAAVAVLNGATLKSTYTTNGSGNFNTTSNWSAGIPSAINAEADFLGAITSNHTVYSDTAITCGTILFNNSCTYVLAGAGSLTMDSTAANAIVNVQAGTQKITLPVTIASNTVFEASAGATLVIDGPVTVNSGQILTESGSGTVTFLTPVTINAGGSAAFLAGTDVQVLTLGPASTADIIASPTGEKLALQVSGLSLSSNSIFNLNGQDLIVAGGSLAQITGQITAGLTGGAGIKSSGLSHFSTIGVIANSGASGTLYSSYDQAAVTASDILVRTTEYGDANLDGIIDGSDYALIDNGYINHLTGWYNGDFNYGGVVNGSDYTLIDNSYNSSHAIDADVVAQSTDQIAQPTTAVPEPVLASMLLIGSLSLRRRRVTRHLTL